MKILFDIYDFISVFIDNAFSPRWWYVWFFQLCFILILLSRAETDTKNSSLYLFMMVWTTMAVVFLNIEASYSDQLRKQLKRLHYLSMAKTVVDEQHAD